MSANIKITRGVRDYLLKHVNEIEQMKGMLLKKHYSDDVIEGNNFGFFINDYIASINSIIEKAKISMNAKFSCPFVIIGSIVTVKDIDDNEIYNYLITTPYLTYTETDADNASCLSPLGRALLLKRVDDKVNVNIPAGILHYVIKDIVVPELSKSEDANIHFAGNSSVGNLTI